MNINIPAVKNGILEEKYGSTDGGKYHLPLENFEVQLSNIPANTKMIGISIVDFDAVEVSGRPFIHWIQLGEVKEIIPENVEESDYQHVTGKNSTYPNMNDPHVTDSYLGPMPPITHTYTLKAYALDTEVSLDKGFLYNKFRRSIMDHIIESEEFEFDYEIKG